MPFFLFLLCFAGTVSGSQSGINCRGCTPLDSHTFDKLVSHFRFALVKFDAAYPYGLRHEQFAKVAAEAGKFQDLLVGEVGIKDYGEKDNEELAERYDHKDVIYNSSSDRSKNNSSTTTFTTPAAKVAVGGIGVAVVLASAAAIAAAAGEAIVSVAPAPTTPATAAATAIAAGEATTANCFNSSDAFAAPKNYAASGACTA